MKKIIFTDIDGTLLNMPHPVPDSAVWACKQARKNGHFLYISTGRPLIEISSDVTSIGFDGIISGAGARIDVNGEKIFEIFMKKDIVLRIATFLDDNQKPFIMEMGEKMLYNKYFPAYLKNLRAKWSGKPQFNLINSFFDVFEAGGLIEEHDYSNIKVQKIIFMGDGLPFEKVAERFIDECEIFRGSIPAFGYECGEMNPRGITKGYALELVAKHHNIPIEDTIAIGDSENDSAMIEKAGIGIAMGDAPLSLKKIANYVTASVEDNGIEKALRHFNLI